MEYSEGNLRLRSQPLKLIETKRRTKGGENVEMVTKKDEEEEEPLSPAARMFHEPDFNVYVVAIMGCTTQICPEVFKDKLVHTLLKHPRFSSLQVRDERVGAGGMKWVRTDVDLDKHIIVPEIDPRTVGSPQKVAEDYVSELSKTSIDFSRPLWDIHILNLHPLTPSSSSSSSSPTAATVVGESKEGEHEEKAFGILRAHHSLGDGTSLMSLLLACTRQKADPTALPTMPTTKKKKKEESGGGIGWWWRRWLRAVWWGVSMGWNTAVDVVMFMATSMFLKDTETPLKGPPGLEFTPRRFVHRTVSLDDIKLIKNAMNTTINDVALGIAQAGLSFYLNRKYGEGKKTDEKPTQKRNNLPKRIRLRSTLLINLRPAGMQALADMMEKDSEAKWGNWIGFVLLPFTIGVRDDPLDYVREAKATVDRKKHSLEALFTFYLSDIFLKLFGIKWAGALSHQIMTKTTFCFSNLAGPVEEIRFYGYPITCLAPSSYGQPHGLMINFQSYANKMSIVLSVDEGTIPDAHQLCDDFVDSLNLIKDAVISKGLVKT